MTVRRSISIALTATALLAGSCIRWQSAPALPARNTMVLDQLIVFSDSPLPQHHRLLEELRLQRATVSAKLALRVSDEPIHVYLFPTAERFESFMHVRYPDLPLRRAFFVESDTRLMVYAYWGDRVAEDLRHEVAHGYLHGVVPRLPLWLDEGLAEYFEVPPGMAGLNRPHVELLADAATHDWRPNLPRLEHLDNTTAMSQTEYAESWAWIHFLLETSPERLQVLQNHLQSLARGSAPEPLSVQLRQRDPAYQQRLVDYVASLRQALR